MRGAASHRRERRDTTSRLAIALGSNLGSRRRNLRYGRSELARFLRDLRCSRIYETEPHGVRAQPRFLNACCTGRAALGAEEVLRRLQEIERAAGRPPGGLRHGPRVLDLDLLLYGDRVIDRPGLRVPHPRMKERSFVLLPLSEVAPEWVHPEVGRTVAELAAELAAGSAGRTLTWNEAEER